MKLDQATRIAQEIVTLLAPHCDRIEIAGSIRREVATVKDIEIVCIPSQDPPGQRHAKFIHLVEQWEKVKGQPTTGKYTQRILPEGIKLDLFMCHAENWGFIFAMRTGSAEFSHKVLANRWVSRGYKGVQGMLCRKSTGEQVPLQEEQDLFDLIGLPWIDPQDRRDRAHVTRILSQRKG